MDETILHFLVCTSPEEMKFAQDAENVILQGLGNNILEHLGNVELGQPIKIFLCNQANEVVGGVIANCFGGWMYVSLLWLEKTLRNLGYGTHLMHIAESEAVKCGNTNAHVDTYSFEAKPFYEKLGYEVFAILKDYPPGNNKYFLKKHLVS